MERGGERSRGGGGRGGGGGGGGGLLKAGSSRGSRGKVKWTPDTRGVDGNEELDAEFDGDWKVLGVEGGSTIRGSQGRVGSDLSSSSWSRGKYGSGMATSAAGVGMMGMGDDDLADDYVKGGSLPGAHGKDGVKLPSVAGISSIHQIKRSLFTSYPGRPSVKTTPPLLTKMEGIIKKSGLFVEKPQGLSRDRLDVMRIVFALFCESARVYKPVLGMIQREYEEHVAMYDKMKSKQVSLEDDLETGNDYYAQQTNEMKRRWKERLRKANEAVKEWQELYRKLQEEGREGEELLRSQKAEVQEMEMRCAEMEKERDRVAQDNDRLARECNRLLHDAGRTALVEREKNQLEEQVSLLTAQLADMKTQKEVQLVHVSSQVKDYNKQKQEAKEAQRRVAQLEAEMEQLTPRPDWSAISSRLLPAKFELPLGEGARTSGLVAAMGECIQTRPAPEAAEVTRGTEEGFDRRPSATSNSSEKRDSAAPE